MSKDIKVSFSSNGIEELVSVMMSLKEDIDKLPDKMAKEIAEDGAEYLKDLYQGSIPDNMETPEVSVEKTDNGYAIVGKGKDILYIEYGTGQVGYDNQHPEKPSELKPYMDGDFVKSHINSNGRHYWFHKGAGDYDNGYTEGIPAGKQFFDTRNYILKKIKETENKMVGDMLSKL